MIGRGFEPVLVYLEEMPRVAAQLGEGSLELVSQTVWKMSRSPQWQGHPALPADYRRGGAALWQPGAAGAATLDSSWISWRRTTGSIHGFHTTIPSPSLPDLLERMPYLLRHLTCPGLGNWIDYGMRHYGEHPDRQSDYFSLQSADSRAVLQRERHGTLFVDNERRLDLYLRALWREAAIWSPTRRASTNCASPCPISTPWGCASRMSTTTVTG